MLSMFDPAVNRMQKNVLFPLLHFGHHDHQKTLNIKPTFIMQKIHFGIAYHNITLEIEKYIDKIVL